MIYDLSSDFDREKFKLRVNKLFENKKVVELTEKTNRTLKQNSYLHLIISYFALETGNTIEYVKREYYKIYSNRDLYVREEPDKITGEIIIKLRSSRDLTKDEMTLSIERFRNWAAENGYYLPSSEEHKYLQQIEIDIYKNKKYL